MINSVIFDVVISMVFLYLLYSLLTSILGEMISSWFGIRGHILNRAIERMLTDGDAGDRESIPFIIKMYLSVRHELTRIGQCMRGVVLKRSVSNRKNLAARFYSYPSVRYLTEGKKIIRSDRPSYISGDLFAQTMFFLLKEKGCGTDDMECIGFCLRYNTLDIQPETLLYLRDIYTASGGNAVRFTFRLRQWFDETMCRTTGWYKRRMQLISLILGFVIAVSFNIDSIEIVHSLSKDDHARDKLVELAVATSKESRDGRQAPDHPEFSQTLLEQSLGAVNSDIQKAHFVMGLGWKFSAQHPDTVRINYSDSLMYSHMYGKRVSVRGTGGNSSADIGTGSVTKNTKGIPDTQVVSVATIDTLKHVYYSMGDSLENWVDSIAIRRSWLCFGLGDSTENKNALVSYHGKINRLLPMVNKALSTSFTSVDSCRFYSNHDSLILTGSVTEVTKGFWNRCRWLLGECTPVKAKVWGFLITAIMVSMGAPFWFGLLQKLLALRSSGVKPEENEAAKGKAKGGASFPPDGSEGASQSEEMPPEGSPDSSPAAQTSPPAGASAPDDESVSFADVETALRIYSDSIRDAGGVVSVFQGYARNSENGGTGLCVQINVNDADTGVRIKDRYRSFRVGNERFVPLTLQVTGYPELDGNGRVPKEFSLHDRAIAHQTELHGWGSAGCLVRRWGDDRTYLLSCLHVVSGSLDVIEKTENQTVINEAGNISTEYRGYLNRYLDIALVPVGDPGEAYFRRLQGTPAGCRRITADDVYTLNVQLKGAATGTSHGVIVHDSVTHEFSYPLPRGKCKQHQIRDLLAIADIRSHGMPRPVTRKGDSGALVSDAEGKAVGIVLGSDRCYTYAMKMSTILELLNCDLV